MAGVPSTSQKAIRVAKGPHVNLFDLPELLPGAKPSANPAQREEFEQRCRQLHLEELSEERAARREVRMAAGHHVTATDLEEMFPNLDAQLVRALCADAPTPQHAIETLLALAASTAEPVAGGEAPPRATTPPPIDLGVEDHEKFPTLVDSSGWQVASQQQFEKDPDEELGNVWRDRAHAAKDMPAPKATYTGATVGRRRTGKKEEDCEPLQQEFMTDYEYRQRAGQLRAKHRVLYGRGSGRCRPGATSRGRGTGGYNPPRNVDGSDSEDSEALDIDAI
jgi:hypothetical protein